MKEIPLTHGKVAIVDDEDYELLNQWKWHYGGGGGYAVRHNYKSSKQTRLFMHRVIMNTPEGMQTDHINGDRLDNRRENLRICTNAENMRNSKKHKNNTSGFKGVSRCKDCNRWRAYINCDNDRHNLGLFLNPVDAAYAYDTKAIELFGEFANINFKESAQ
jgi:hypothetical protein